MGRNGRAVGIEKAHRPCAGDSEPDARALEKSLRLGAAHDAQVAVREIDPIERSVDRERAAQVPWPARQPSVVDSRPSGAHRFDSTNRLGSSDQYSGADPGALGRHVETEMVSIDEVDVRRAGSTERARVAFRRTAICVTRWIDERQVRFRLDDPDDDLSRAPVAGERLTDQQRSDEPAGDRNRRSGKIEWDLARWVLTAIAFCVMIAQHRDRLPSVR